MDFEYTIIRSSRRTLCIEITPDKKVVVRAPYSCPDTDVSRFVLQKKSWIEKHLSAPKAPSRERSSAELTLLKEKAQELIFPRVEYYSKIMGLYPTSVKITSAKRRFGSCSPKNGLCFSLYLAEYPENAIDYVVVHELAHIKHKNHSAAFHNLVRKYLPNEKDLINILKGRTEA